MRAERAPLLCTHCGGVLVSIDVIDMKLHVYHTTTGVLVDAPVQRLMGIAGAHGNYLPYMWADARIHDPL